MENEIKQIEQRSLIADNVALDQIWRLSEDILSDCKLKKGKKAKFIKHIERVNQISPNVDGIVDQPLILAYASLYKNLGKLGEHEQSLLKAIKIISNLEKFKPVAVRWLLQVAALKSSKKQHQECYEIALKAFDMCQDLLAKIQAGTDHDHSHSELLFIKKITQISNEKTKDEIIWLVNQRCLAEEMLEHIRRSSDSALHIPYFPTEEFHIADYMSLEECPKGWEQINRKILKDLVIYLSICCFTMATEKYYLKNYTQKYNHLKSLKIALCSFDINCSYVTFLLKILNQHFGKRLELIEQEHFETADRYEMRRLMPKDTKEVNMKLIQFAEE